MYARFFWARCACLAPSCLGRPRLAQIVLMIAFRECIAVKYRTLPDLPPPEHFVFTMSEQIAGGVQRLHGVCVRTHEVLARTNPKYGTKWCACPVDAPPACKKEEEEKRDFGLCVAGITRHPGAIACSRVRRASRQCSTCSTPCSGRSAEPVHPVGSVPSRRTFVYTVPRELPLCPLIGTALIRDHMSSISPYKRARPVCAQEISVQVPWTTWEAYVEQCAQSSITSPAGITVVHAGMAFKVPFSSKQASPCTFMI